MRRQFSLTRLLLFTLLACAALAVVGQYHSTERLVVAEIEALGGRINRRQKGIFYFDPGIWVSRRWPEVFDNVEEVYLSGTDFGGGMCWKLSALSEIETLVLSSTGTSDEDLADICRLNKLTWLGLSDSKITDRGMLNLLGATHLNVLQLDGCRITDSGVMILSHLPDLEVLVLDRCPVTDGAILSLIAIPKLKVLHLCDTLVTPEGARKLIQAVPRAEIYYQEGKALEQ
jgi:hypothetical protein